MHTHTPTPTARPVAHALHAPAPAAAPPDLGLVLARLDALGAQLAELNARQHARAELIEDLTPVARDAMAAAAARLDALEKDGTMAFGAALLDVGRRVVGSFSADDVRALGDSIVGMLETVRTVTEPAVLRAEPVGMLAFARATRKDDVRKGLGVLLEMLRRLGREADRNAPPPPQALAQRDKLAAMLGPRRARPALPASTGTPARATPPPVPPRARAVPPPVPARAAAATPARAPACATPAPASSADPDWTRTKGEATAAAQGVALGDAHWAVIDAARADFAATQVSPNLRRLTQISNMTTKQLYALFPKAPGRAIAAIAGLPKPAGCL